MGMYRKKGKKERNIKFLHQSLPESSVTDQQQFWRKVEYFSNSSLIPVHPKTYI
jgi:hypothetical protein